LTSKKDELEKVRKEFKAELSSIKTIDELAELKTCFLGKKGKITVMLKNLGKLDPEERPVFGKAVNGLREEAEEDISASRKQLYDIEMTRKEKEDSIDVTLPPRGRTCGGFHPVAQVTHELVEILSGLGFSVALGPEIEDDFYNFEALNIPRHHPARDMQDTFYFDDGKLLRTHTSPVEVRAMQAFGAPLRVIVPGKVYRRDSDPTHSPMFHQLEGLLLDEDISIADLKGCLDSMLDTFFGRHLKKRYRASYFPFTEPSLELDIECVACSGKDRNCRICKGGGWLEISGLGMTHPNVIRAGGIDPEKYNGFAWGMGLDRLAMLKYGLNDLRILFDGNVPYLLSGRDQ